MSQREKCEPPPPHPLSVQQARVPPVDVLRGVVALEGAAESRLRDQLGVLEGLLERLGPVQLAGVGPERSFRPRLCPGDVPLQAALSLVQVVDHVVVVVVPVVVEVFVLQELRPGIWFMF